MGSRFDRAIAAIDARNADDPHTLTVDGVARPKELTHAAMVTDWVKRLNPNAGEPLLLAARAHHIRRWAIPRDSYPPGRVPYLQWRRALQDLHASELRTILEAGGYGQETIDRAEWILRKRDLKADPDCQTLEDAVCLVFIETQFLETARKIEHGKMVEVVRKTLAKMTGQGREAALRLELPDEAKALIAEALAG
ncbi:MAG: DUF4202 domain-containing protein [Bryobacterales bacterium]|nr:DUF4202 domain-containing protein [Bryobacterales bacterium]